MNYIIIGLGNFGLALAEKLTAMGNDVLGVDSDINLVEEYKNRIDSTVCVNLTDASSLKSLPLDDADVVVVTLGEKVGNSVLVVALLKQAGVKRLVARAGSDLHSTILEAIGVDEVIRPELNAAELFALASDRNEVKSVYVVSDTTKIVEYEVPGVLVAQSLAQADIEETFGVKLVAVKRKQKRTNLFGKESFTYEVVDKEAADFCFAEDDRMLLFGDIAALQKVQEKLY